MTYPTDPTDQVDEQVIISEEPQEIKETVVQEQVVARTSSGAMLSRLTWLIMGFVQAVIAIRIILKLIAANSANAFVNLIYTLSELFVWPFASIVQNPAFNDAVLEVTSMIAMIVYLLVAYGLVELVWLLTRPAGEKYRVRERRIRRR
jgi:uncharacterized membrane protein YuzA (DUF378 family)